MNILQYSPGQVVTIALQILNSASGLREDGYSTPFVSKITLPDLTASPAYPLSMIRIETGLYYHKFVLPVGAAAVGSYLVDLSYTTAANAPKQDLVQVVCIAAGGSFSVSPG